MVGMIDKSMTDSDERIEIYIDGVGYVPLDEDNYRVGAQCRVISNYKQFEKIFDPDKQALTKSLVLLEELTQELPTP